MQKRAEYAGLIVDRSCFFKILDKNIIQLCDGVKRLICRKEVATVVNMTSIDGLITIRNVNYDFKDEYINVYHFETNTDPRTLRFEEQNIATENKIKLEKQDIKTDWERKSNHDKNYINHQIIQHQQVHRPITAPSPIAHPQPQPQPQPQHQPTPQQIRQYQMRQQQMRQQQMRQQQMRPPQMRQRYGNSLF
jgi:hypothetical protein